MAPAPSSLSTSSPSSARPGENSRDEVCGKACRPGGAEIAFGKSCRDWTLGPTPRPPWVRALVVGLAAVTKRGRALGPLSLYPSLFCTGKASSLSTSVVVCWSQSTSFALSSGAAVEMAEDFRTFGR